MSQNFDYILVDFASPHFFASRCELWLNSLSIKQDVDGCFSTRVVSVSWHFKFHECVYVCVCVYVLYTYIVHKSDFFVHKKLKITYFHSLCCIFFFSKIYFQGIFSNLCPNTFRSINSLICLMTLNCKYLIITLSFSLRTSVILDSRNSHFKFKWIYYTWSKHLFSVLYWVL